MKFIGFGTKPTDKITIIELPKNVLNNKIYWQDLKLLYLKLLIILLN